MQAFSPRIEGKVSEMRFNSRLSILLTSLLVLSAAAEAAKVTVGAGSGSPGGSVSLPLTFSAEGASVAGLQLDLQVPQGLSVSSVSVGSAATAAGKQVQFAAVSGGVRILVWGLNTTVIGDGAVASVALSIASSALSGSVTVSATNALASDASGNAVTLSTASGTVTISSGVPPDKTMLLSQNRVAVSVRYRNQYSGATGDGTPVKQLDQYGYFWFDSAGNPEVFVKVLDFGGTNFLVFHSALSDLEYTVTFTVQRTGQSYVFNRPAGSVCGAADGSTVQK
jgi:hypothetical protein